MASHASVQFGEEQKSPSPRRPSSEISEGTAALSTKIFLACGRRCASSERTIRYRIARGPGF